MSKPTDPRVEAAARALCAAAGYSPDDNYITPRNFPEMDVNWKVYAPDAEIALKAADAAAWQPIESAPKDGETSFDIWVTSKEDGYRISNVMRSDAVWVFDLMEWPDEMVPATHWMQIPPAPGIKP